ncbi:MAG: leucine-rich repeat protein [Odoribacteraceae bacterium]|jgi:hypothetical protein|nr:leucine-rich repeat protein [Odoribacteraceae bacterium]
MKKIIYYLSAILMLSFLSCGEDTPEETPDTPDPTPETPVAVEIQGTASLSRFIEGADLSRAGVDGNLVTWGDYESFRLYDSVAKKVSDTRMSFGKTNGAATATFTGMVAHVEGTRNFYAIFPYSVGSSTTGLDKYPVSISPDQNSNDAAGKYLIGVASTAFTGNPGDENPLNLQFKYVSARWNINITNDEGLDIKSVKVMTDPNGSTSDDRPFVTDAIIDIKKDYTNTEMRVVPLIYASSVGTTFPTGQTTETVSANLFLLPTVISGDLKIAVTLSDNTSLSFPLPGFEQEFVGGTLYTSNIDLEDAEKPEEPEPEPDPDFTVVDGMLTAYLGTGGDITIPANVTAIRDGEVGRANTGVFESNSLITSIDLNNVVTVGINAFKSCANLTRVNASNVETIKCEGFHNCPKLEEVNSPKLKSVGTHCFQSCTVLKTIDLSKVVEFTISGGSFVTGQRAFRLCKALETVDLSSFEGTIPFQMFIGCDKLTTVITPKVTAVGGTDAATANRGQVFADCPLLKALDFPLATVLSWRAVNALVTTLNVPKVAILQPQALCYCADLRYIRLPSLVEIGNSAFATNITNIVIDLSEATGLTTVGTNIIQDVAGVKIYVATEEIKALFPAYVNAKVTVGAPPQ